MTPSSIFGSVLLRRPVDTAGVPGRLGAEIGMAAPSLSSGTACRGRLPRFAHKLPTREVRLICSSSGISLRFLMVLMGSP